MATTQETSVIEVIGAGASGRALAFLLLKSGCPVRLLGRSGPIKQLTVIENKVKKSIELPPLHAEPAMHLLTVPAHGLKEASESIQQTTSAPIVPLCNGYLGDKYYQKPYAAGINYIASTFNRATDEVSLFSSVPGVFLPKSLAQLMPQNLPFIHFVDSVKQKRAEKFFANAVLNTICGAHDLETNGMAKEIDNFQKVTLECLELTDSLYETANVGFSSQEEAIEHFLLIAKQTANNTNSMVQALRRGAKTEAAFISGHANADRHPNLFSLHQMILSKSKHL